MFLSMQLVATAKLGKKMSWVDVKEGSDITSDKSNIFSPVFHKQN